MLADREEEPALQGGEGDDRAGLRAVQAVGEDDQPATR